LYQSKDNYIETTECVSKTAPRFNPGQVILKFTTIIREKYI